MKWALVAGLIVGGSAMAEVQAIDAEWSYVADTVMGGVSNGKVTRDVQGEENSFRLQGVVSLENNGGFIQMTTDLSDIDARDWTGLRLTLHGNDEAYDIRLRTSELTRPWQSYRTDRTVGTTPQVYEVPFAEFTAHRTDLPLNLEALTRVGILAIGREFEADVTVLSMSLYR